VTAHSLQRGRLNEAVILFVLFFGPVFLALVVYLGPWEIIPDRSAVYGVVIEPVRQLPSEPVVDGSGVTTGADWLRGSWFLIYRSPAGCGPACARRIAALERVHRGLAEDSPRLARILLYRGAVTPAPAGGWLSIPAATGAAAEFDALLETAHPGPIYISDPVGNLVLAYADDANTRGIQKDLERLLRLSRIG
jgi:hypothetical protein